MTHTITAASQGHMGPERLQALTRGGLLQAGMTAAPVMLLAVAVGFCANVLQVGLHFTPALLRTNPQRLDPFQGLKRLVTPRSFVEIAKGGVKLGIVGYSGWRFIAKHWSDILSLSSADPQEISPRVASMAYGMALQMVSTLTVVAVLDYAYQRWQFERSIRMTKQEVKDEHRDSEGNPHIRGRIRKRQREFARRRMMADVPHATVVIMNPTHFAMALKYELGQTGAPRVVAKGRDRIALRIRSIAEENGVPVVEDPPLARALYDAADLGEEIPSALYRAVAEVLAMVWKLDARRREATL